MSKEKLSKEIWIKAGFQSLAEAGPTAISVATLAARLGATKGSFYWHFKDLGGYKATMLEVWRSKVATEIIADALDQTDPIKRFDVILANALRVAPDDYGGARIEPAFRAWALSDPLVADALAQIDATRIEFLNAMFRDIGLDDPAVAELTYGAYIGLDDLRSKGVLTPDAALGALRSMVVAATDH